MGGGGLKVLWEALDVYGFGLLQNLTIGLVPFNPLKSMLSFCLSRTGSGFRLLQ